MERNRISTSLWALTWLAFFMADVRDGLGPFLATYLQETKFQQEWIGYTMTAGGLAGMVMTPMAGAWVDKYRQKRAMTVVASIAVIAASAIAFTTHGKLVLVGSHVVTGMAGAIIGATMAGLTLGIAKSAGFKHQTGRNEAFGHAGNIVSAIGAGLAAHYFGAPWILAVMVAMGIGVMFSIKAIRAGDIDHEAARGEEPQRELNDDGNHAVDDAVNHDPIRALFSNRPLLLFALACAFFHFGNASMLPLLNQRLAATVVDSAPLLWTGIAIVVAQLAMIPVALWVARSRRFDATWFVYAAILVLPVRGAIAYAMSSAWSNIPVQILDGFAAGALGVATPLLVQRYTAGSGRFNTALGFVMTLQGVGAAISPSFANMVVGADQRFGLAFVCLASVAVIALPVFMAAQRASSIAMPAQLQTVDRVRV